LCAAIYDGTSVSTASIDWSKLNTTFERFNSEIAVFHPLTHDGIVCLHGYTYRTSSNHTVPDYFIMDAVDSCQAWRLQSTMSSSEVLQCATTLALTMAYLHRRGICGLDLIHNSVRSSKGAVLFVHPIVENRLKRAVSVEEDVQQDLQVCWSV
jgi:hypothetical protein